MVKAEIWKFMNRFCTNNVLLGSIRVLHMLLGWHSRGVGDFLA